MRLLVAIGLVVALVAGGAALASWGWAGRGATGEFRVEVVGPSGPLFNGTIHADNATAFSALQATGLTLTTDDYPGMGTYVRAVAGIEATGATGWVYEVLRDGAWLSGDRSSAKFALEPGDALRWSWTGA